MVMLRPLMSQVTGLHLCMQVYLHLNSPLALVSVSVLLEETLSSFQVAAAFHYPKVCQRLLSMGADACASTWGYNRPEYTLLIWICYPCIDPDTGPPCA